jgi:hypothetical protein
VGYQFEDLEFAPVSAGVELRTECNALGVAQLAAMKTD